MALTMVDTSRPVTGGVDTHLDLNVAAALDGIGGLLGVEQFPTTTAGNKALLGWLRALGTVVKVGVEGTGSYGAPLARYLRRAGVEVVEVDRPNRQERRRKGKTDTVDAIEAARAAQGERQLGAAKTRDGNVEAIRALVVAKRSAKSTKIKASTRSAIWVSPPPRRSASPCPGLTSRMVAKQAAAMRPRAGSDPVVLRHQDRPASFGPAGPGPRRRDRRDRPAPRPSCSETATRTCSRSTASASTAPPRCWSPPATTPTGSAPSRPGPGCAASPRSKPPPARSSATGSTPGGDRHANAALWTIVITRMSSDPRTRLYVERRSKEGRSKKEIIRVLKRYVAREIYYYLKPL